MFHGGSSLRKFSKKSKKFQNSKNAQNRPQKSPNENFQSRKLFQNSKKAQNRSQNRPNVFWTCFGVIFSKNLFAQCSMEGRVFENFQKNPKIFKIPKMPKIVRKSVQTCFEDVLEWFFSKIFCPVFHGGSSLRKFSKKSKKFQISKNAQNRPQKCPNENFQNQKKIQKSKHAQNRSQKCPNVFWSCFRVIFSRKFFAQCSMEGRVFGNFQKNQKSFKIPKMPKIVPKKVQTKIFKVKKFFKIPKKPKIVPKTVQTCFEDVLGWFFRKNFLPSVRWRVESSKVFKKIKKVSTSQKCPKSSPKVSKRKFSKSKKFQISKKAQNRSQKCPNVFWTSLGLIFPKKNFCPVFHGGSSLRKISKKSKNFQNSKNAQIRSQKCPNVFWRCFRLIFSKKIFAQCSMEGRVFESFQKDQKSFNVPKMPKIVPKSVQTKIFKIKKISNFQKSPKSFPKVSKRVLNKFRVNLSEKKFLPSVPWRVESSKNFKKIQKFSKFQKCPNTFPKVSKRVLKMF